MNTLNSSKEISELSFENANVKKAFVIATEDEKQTVTFFQNVWKRSSVSRAHLSHHIYTAHVEWYCIGHEKLNCMIYNKYTIVLY